jgi:hypothetical protein
MMAAAVLDEVHDDNPERLGAASLPTFVLSAAAEV